MASKPKNIILMIGDGMGLAQISLAMYNNNHRLNLEDFPVIGFHKPYSNSDLITDSGAGATAFSCGVKTYNHAIGMKIDSTACYSILEEAEANGLATGLIATATIVHATPASFIAHQKLRVFYEAIASDFLNTEIDLFIGGGLKYFNNRKKDNRNLYRELQQKGYYVSDFINGSLRTVRPNPEKNFAFFTGNSHPLPATAGRTYLPYASAMATNFLKMRSDKGFFLMIEGSQIDMAGHGNDSRWVVQETLDFDKAVGEVLKFAKREGNTLVIVTADHETGGLSLSPNRRETKIKPAFNTNGHSGVLVPVFAFGPSAKLFAGIYENTAIYHKMRRAIGFSTSTTAKAKD